MSAMRQSQSARYTSSSPESGLDQSVRANQAQVSDQAARNILVRFADLALPSNHLASGPCSDHSVCSSSNAGTDFAISCAATIPPATAEALSWQQGLFASQAASDWRENAFINRGVLQNEALDHGLQHNGMLQNVQQSVGQPRPVQWQQQTGEVAPEAPQRTEPSFAAFCALGLGIPSETFVSNELQRTSTDEGLCAILHSDQILPQLHDLQALFPARYRSQPSSDLDADLCDLLQDLRE